MITDHYETTWADYMTRQITERAQQEVARDFSTWLSTGGSSELAKWTTRTGKVYVTERALANIVARTTLALGEYVARGALIKFAACLSTYIDPDTFNAECIFALRTREGKS